MIMEKFVSIIILALSKAHILFKEMDILHMSQMFDGVKMTKLSFLLEDRINASCIGESGKINDS